MTMGPPGKMVSQEVGYLEGGGWKRRPLRNKPRYMNTYQNGEGPKKEGQISGEKGERGGITIISTKQEGRSPIKYL